MRILHLVDGDRWTGPAAVVFDQTAALRQAGVEAQFGFFADSLLSRRLHPLGWARPLLRRTRGPVAYARLVRDLRETILREGFGVVHAHRSFDHTAAALAVRGTPARLARTLHHIRHARPDPVTRSVFARTRAFAYANRAIAETFGRPGPILPPVVDTERFRPAGDRGDLRRRLGLPETALLFGTVGKLSRGRGHAEAIAAAAALPPPAALVHVGHGEHLDALRRLAADLGAAERNFWLGYQEDALPEITRSWDVFVFAASGSDQGQRAILEAMASGVPVAALDLPGVRDLVTNGVEGLVAADESALRAALGRLAADAGLRAAMGGRARARALAFTGPKFSAGAIPFYEALLAGPVSGSESRTS